MLITFEGLPGAGKSTQVQLLDRCLRAAGRPVTTVADLATLHTQAVATDLIELLRAAADPFLRTGDAITDTLITAAVRADLVATVLDPALNATPATVVIEDRGIHTMASYAIASLLRQYRAPTSVALDWLDALSALTGPRPAHALWLRVPPDLAARRAGQRNAGTRPPFTSEQAAYLALVDHAYQLLAQRDPHLTVLDITDLDPLQTHDAVHHALDQVDRTGDTTVSACTADRRTHLLGWRRSEPKPRVPNWETVR